MEFNVEKKNDEVIEISYNITAEEWQKKLDDAYNKTKGKYKIEGFRAGKAPRKMIEKNYGESVFFQEAFNNVVTEEYLNYLTNNKDVQPVGDHPHFDIDTISQDGVKFKIIIELMPKVTLGQYKGLEFKKSEVEFKDEMVDAELKKIQSQLTTKEKLPEDKAIENGNWANINFVGSVNGVNFDGGTADNYSLKIGSHSFIDTFEEQLIGKKAGDTIDVKVKFPENYGAKNLADKDAVFAVTINFVEKDVIPELDKEFAKKLGDFEDLEALKVVIKKNLEAHAQSQATIKDENNIMRKLIETSQIKVPTSLLEQNLEYAIQEFEYRLSQQGLDMESYCKYTKQTEEDIKENLRKQTEEGLKGRFIRDEIIKIENIKIEQSDIENKMLVFATSTGKTLKEFQKSLQKNQLDMIIDEVVADKFFEFMTKENKLV